FLSSHILTIVALPAAAVFLVFQHAVAYAAPRSRVVVGGRWLVVRTRFAFVLADPAAIVDTRLVPVGTLAVVVSVLGCLARPCAARGGCAACLGGPVGSPGKYAAVA